MAQLAMPAPPGKRRRVSEEAVAGWVSVSPWIVGFLIFTLGPLLASFYFSFTRYDVLTSPQWIGLDNYVRLLTNDSTFFKALGNTLVYTALYVPLHLITALVLALLLNEARQWRGIFRTIFYLPSITPAIATAYLFVLILNPNDGLVNNTLRLLHLPAPGWTVDPLWTKPTVVVSQLWHLGGAMIILLAGLKNVPPSLYEAAKLDGAGKLRQIWDITQPGLRPVMAVLLVIALGNVLDAGFDQVFNLYNPAVFSTGDIIDTYVYRIGLLNAQYEIATAVGLFKGVVGMITIVLANYALRRFGERSIW